MQILEQGKEKNVHGEIKYVYMFVKQEHNQMTKNCWVITTYVFKRFITHSSCHVAVQVIVLPDF